MVNGGLKKCQFGRRLKIKKIGFSAAGRLSGFDTVGVR
jgi:hypothetical protein